MSKIIVISGTAGTGKTFLAKQLSVKLNCVHLSIGKIARQKAKDLGLSIYEFQKICNENLEIDRNLDKSFVHSVRKIAKDNCVVIDYRLGALFFPDSFKIYLKTNLNEVVKRIKQREENLTNEADEKVKEIIRFRTEEAKNRFEKMYHFDYQDEKHYNLVIDNTLLTPEQTLQIVLSNLQAIKNA